MNRRDILKSVGLIVGGTVIGADAFLLNGCTFSEEQVGLLSSKQIKLLEEIAETILPHSEKSPGAKDAKVGPFIDRIVSDFYTTQEQQVFLEALTKFKELDFESLKQKEKEAILLKEEKYIEKNDQYTFTNQETGESFETRQPYVMIKQLSIWAYLSSEVVAKNNFNYLPIPGKYTGCVDVEADTKPIYWKQGSRGAFRKI
ncbi:MAG: gluconate 2-dehydrogenase subunit 3 family protein [Reichenbachiella sp.]|uniref:gluconate 2-dehydrogenase subunit 3 family protein n=1 Tax=Reichenbachiella sp. TaxID=2184521 RepID=UPI002966E5CB|nr:gluconate 2-dehydrogenase subunit 3 family protein [Reichenbachiella sp.]MDW3210431.1 gluconate 2-dehydrogenase subunit 3 family protein [Reichenbachiella sp.]